MKTAKENLSAENSQTVIRLGDLDTRPSNFTGIAIVESIGNRWYKGGELHREDGPAVENKNGYKEWFKEGKRHRTNGPAVEWGVRHKEWWIEGERYYSEKEFNEEIESRNKGSAKKG